MPLRPPTDDELRALERELGLHLGADERAVYAQLVAGMLSGYALIPAVVILCREIVVSGLREFLAELNVPLPVTQLAKWKTALQMVAIGVLIVGDAGPEAWRLREIGEIGLWIAAGLTLVTGYDYLRAALGHMRGADARAPKAGRTARPGLR